MLQIFVNKLCFEALRDPKVRKILYLTPVRRQVWSRQIIQNIQILERVQRHEVHFITIPFQN
jgi:hypothetical protein